MAFKLPQLPYDYKALAPHIDARTMKIHHTKHHAGYTNKLNAATAGTPLAKMKIEAILAKLDMTNMAVRNNGGGFYNHSLFWKVMSPTGGGEPVGKMGKAIKDNFGSFEKFKEQFSAAAGTQFGSGWAWLCATKAGKLQICATPNQDNPLMPKTGCGGTPILGLDVWEHAYYLKYQNKRPDYVNAFFEVINWREVSRRYTAAMK